MAFRIEFTQTAADHVRAFRKFDQPIVLDGIEEQLRHQPNLETRRRKMLGAKEFSGWELRVDQFRVFYDVFAEADV
ncbi:MAG TPA: hypothetical protein VL371_00890 [Gemmataceae bacterium]|jgi:mRNA-degrading endonuclease RelE of RelBE toxin-antitoxin system|nr:hypothetical protein [Gemmataceae bacterium]